LCARHSKVTSGWPQAAADPIRNSSGPAVTSCPPTDRKLAVVPSSYEFVPSGLGTRTAMLQIAEKCLVSETFRHLLYHRVEIGDVPLPVPA
jgi:hypothetical protein